MAVFQVIAKPDFLKSLTAAKPLPDVSELIWNGFDAGAKKVVNGNSELTQGDADKTWTG